MASNYPGALDTFAAVSTGQTRDGSGGSPRESTLLTNLGDAIEATQAELGVNPSGSAATVAARLNTLQLLNPVFITDYGAVADSNGTQGNGTNNRSAINSAYTAAVATNRPVFVPPSTNFYRYTSYLDFTSTNFPLVFIGAGRDLSKLYNDEVLSVGMQVQSQKSVHLSGFTLVKRSAGVRTGTATSIFMTQCDQVIVDDVEIDSGDAISLYVSACTKVLVTNCFVHDAYDGIHFEDSVDCAAIGNVCWNNKDDALACINNSGGTLAERIVFSGNSVKDGSARGIVAGSGVQVTITGNNVTNTAGQGIHVETDTAWRDCHELVISGNTITNGGMGTGTGHGYGICVLRINTSHSLSNVLITNNVIKTPRFMFIRVGFYSLAAPILNVQVTGNMCIGPVTAAAAGHTDPAFYPGISLENVIDGVIADNYIEEPYSTGINAFGTSSSGLLVVRNNTVVRPNQGAVGAPWNAAAIIIANPYNAYVQGNVVRDPAAAVTAAVSIDGTTTTISNTNNFRTTAGPA